MYGRKINLLKTKKKLLNLLRTEKQLTSAIKKLITTSKVTIDNNFFSVFEILMTGNIFAVPLASFVVNGSFESLDWGSIYETLTCAALDLFRL